MYHKKCMNCKGRAKGHTSQRESWPVATVQPLRWLTRCVQARLQLPDGGFPTRCQSSRGRFAGVPLASTLLFGGCDPTLAAIVGNTAFPASSCTNSPPSESVAADTEISAKTGTQEHLIPPQTTTACSPFVRMPADTDACQWRGALTRYICGRER